ncbi:MAG: VWA domain-containing protein [Verrucomicrobiota bacterium]
MQFLNPQFLWLFCLALVPLALYLFRRRSKSVQVSTLVFFKTLAREHQESAWLRRLKKLISFLLTMLILSLIVLSLAQLIAKQDDPDEYRTVVLVVDRSASMAAEDTEGRTRLEVAKQGLRERLEQVPDEVGLALVAYDSRPEVLQPRTLTRRELVSRLDEIKVRPISDDKPAALRAAQLLAKLETPAVIWHASDTPFQELMTEESTDESIAESIEKDQVDVRELSVPLEAPINAGITAFAIRPVPLEYSRYEVFLQVGLNEAAPSKQTSKLEVIVGGIPSQYREIELEPGMRESLSFQIEGVNDQLLQLSLRTDNDVFAIDDHVLVPIPRSDPVLAAWIRLDGEEDPYTRLALSAIQESGRFELLKGGPGAWPLRESVDAVIFDGWLPDEWPAGIPVIVINPPRSSGPIVARRLESPIPYDSVRTGNAQHPVLFRVSSSRVAISQTTLYGSAGSLEPLWIAGQDPVLSAGEVDGQRLVVMGFSPGISERLPLTASFPLLMGNSLFWAVGDRMDGSLLLRSTGDFVQLDDSSIHWQQWKGNRVQTVRRPIRGSVVELDQIGAWETESGIRGASHLLSARESDLPGMKDAAVRDPDYFVAGVSAGRQWTIWLISAVVLILLLESWLFHRFSVY